MKARLPVVVVLVLAAVCSGCVDDDKMFFIRQNQVPGDGCMVDTGTDIFRSRGTLDLAVKGYDYWLHPLVENHMLSTQGADNQPERNLLHMRRFTVDVDVPGLGTTSLEVPVSGTINPGGIAAYGGIPVIPIAIQGPITPKPGQQVIVDARVRAVADRSGDEMQSAEFIFPITLCNGCLMVGDPNDACSTANPSAVGNTCGRPQDQPVTCCIDSTGRQVCKQNK